MGKIDEMRRMREEAFAAAERRAAKAPRPPGGSTQESRSPGSTQESSGSTQESRPVARQATTVGAGASKPKRSSVSGSTQESPDKQEKRGAGGEAEPAQPTRPTKPSGKKATKTSLKSGDVIPDQGKCPDCGKMKPLSNGVLASHQKGFGKNCSGSRKAPV